MTANVGSGARHLDALDYIRGVAILGVLLLHVLHFGFRGLDALPWNGWFRGFSSVPTSFLCLLPLGFGGAGVA